MPRGICWDRGIVVLCPVERHQNAPENLIGTGSEAAADALASAPKDYTQVPKLGPPLPGDLGGPILAAQKRGDVVPIPPGPPQTARGPDPEEALRQRIAQERDAARTSRLFLGGGEGKERAVLLLPKCRPLAWYLHWPMRLPIRPTRQESVPF